MFLGTLYFSERGDFKSRSDWGAMNAAVTHYCCVTCSCTKSWIMNQVIEFVVSFLILVTSLPVNLFNPTDENDNSNNTRHIVLQAPLLSFPAGPPPGVAPILWLRH